MFALVVHVARRMAENLDVPARRIEQAEQHFDRGRFARTVGAEQAEDFTAADFKIDVIHRRGLGPAPEILENLGQAANGDNGLTGLGMRPGAAGDSATALMRWQPQAPAARAAQRAGAVRLWLQPDAAPILRPGAPTGRC